MSRLFCLDFFALHTEIRIQVLVVFKYGIWIRIRRGQSTVVAEAGTREVGGQLHLYWEDLKIRWPSVCIPGSCVGIFMGTGLGWLLGLMAGPVKVLQARHYLQTFLPAPLQSLETLGNCFRPFMTFLAQVFKFKRCPFF